MSKPFFQAAGFIPQALAAATIVTGGTAIQAAIGPCNGGFITNPLNATAQGIATAENIYIDMTKAPGSTDSTGNGTTIIIQPGQNFTLPSLAPGQIVYVNAATNGHKLSGEIW